jgi:tetrahydromethanopterin S-methyltransferase subunit B
VPHCSTPCGGLLTGHKLLSSVLLMNVSHCRKMYFQEGFLVFLSLKDMSIYQQQKEGDPWTTDEEVSQFPLALSPKTKRTRSYTSRESTHVTSGVNTRQTPSNLTGIRTMEITAWLLDALSSRDRRSSGRGGLSRRSGRVDI